MLALGLLLAPSTIPSSFVPLAQPRSYEELTVLVNDQPFPNVQFSFVLVNPVGPYKNYTKALDLMLNVSIPGSELTIAGAKTWGAEAENVWNATFDMTAQVTASAQANLTRDPDTPLFTTVNVLVNYTDYQGNFPRYIVRSVTFALNYRPPANSLLLPAAMGMGLGGAGLLGLGLFVVRRAKLQELFLMHDSGMLIRHWARGAGLEHDSDIMSGMFIVLQEFVRDTLKSHDDVDADLEELRFGSERVILARSRHSVLAAVVKGRYLNGLPRKLRRAIDDFELSHEAVLANWNGNPELLPKADAIVDRFLKGPAKSV